MTGHKEQIKYYLLKASENRIIQHIFFWLFVISAFIIAKGSFRYGNSKDFIFLIFLGLLVPILAAYIFNYFLIPRLYNKKRFLSFSLLFIFFVYIFSALTRVVIVYLAEPLFRDGDHAKESLPEILLDYSYLLDTYIPTLFLVSFSLAFVRQQKIKKATVRKNLILEKEKAEAELKFLKAQVHPHFLFNTLNSLYVLCLKKSEKAPEMVIRLSEILDYILYKGKEKLVLLEKEIRLLDNYIALEKMRFGEDLSLSFEKNIDYYNTPISPLLLITLVENAFKHGASGIAEQRIVSISLEVKSGQLTFEVFNTRDRIETKAEMDQRKGIGLSNLQKQLSILYEESSIEIEALEDDYRVKMWINLNSSIAHIPDSAGIASDDPFLDFRSSNFLSML